ncbi:DUF6705 family protein [Chryseobacterium tongliaoense]|uniref:DUF6705 family protein n=1 Tax=Chryseobacterium tongliaoense TaxID=3240933 RepID=UPI003513233B
MKNTLFISTFLLMMISCKAQVIGTLEQFEECQKRPNRDEGCPDLDNITYVKDTNNRLNQFVGTWKGSFAGKQYEIHFEKIIQFGDDIKWDRIFGRMIIKNNSGTIIYNSLNKSLSETGLLRGSNFRGRVYLLSFVANSYCNDSGEAFIEISKTNPNQMTLFFDRDKTSFNPAKCPNFSTYVPTLPKDKMILIKQ